MTFTMQSGNRIFVIGFFGGIVEYVLKDGQRKFVYTWSMVD